MQNSGRTKFKRTSIDRLMNTLVLWVRLLPGSLPLPTAPPAPGRSRCSRLSSLVKGSASFRLPLDLEDVIYENLRNGRELRAETNLPLSGFQFRW